MVVMSKSHPLYVQLANSGLMDRLEGQTFENPYRDSLDFLVSHGFMTQPQALQMMENAYACLAISLKDFKSSVDALAALSQDLCRDLGVLPLGITKTHISLAMADPWDKDSISFVKMKSCLNVSPVSALKSDILSSAEKQYSTTDALTRAIDNIMGDESAVAATPQQIQPDIKIEWEDAPVIKLVNYIFQQGISLRASDIHLEPGKEKTSLRYRIDGVLHAYSAPPPDIYRAVVSRIKVLANMDVSETRFPQDGRITFNMGIRSIDFRVSIIPFVGGEGVDIRILDKGGVTLDLKMLGLPDDQYAMYEKAFKSPHGLILSCGPTGSGKTTTLYATLKLIATPDKKTITVEDPVEYEMLGIQQSMIREDIGYTFEMGLKAILRHDPDIVMIGEMRDLESAEIAVRSALTGHLVLSTLHTNDSVSSITRMVDMGIKDYLVPAVLQCAMSQRLVRKLCKSCRKKTTVPKERFERLELDAETLKTLPDSVEVYEAVGCPACKDIGYIGRTAIYEILDAENLFRHAQIRKMSLQQMIDLAIQLGMIPLRAAGLRRVLKGVTSLEEVIKVTADY